MIQTYNPRSVEPTPLARAVIRSLDAGLTARISSQVLYKKKDPKYTSENKGNSPSIDVVATDVAIEFPGTRCEMLKRLREIGIKSEDIGGPFKECGLERCTYFQAPCQDSGTHETSITIYCQPEKL